MKPIKFGEKDNLIKTRRVKRLFKKILPVFLIIGILFTIAFFISGSSGSKAVVNFVFNISPLKSTNDRVNVLLLGIAGGIHGGANLTDTIIVASYDLKKHEAYLISIPRDLWLPSFKSKVNSIYQTGLNQNNGLGLAKTVMGNIVGLPIHYALRVDFGGFVKAVDAIGGIDIIVEKSFDDYKYPIDGEEDNLCGYQEKEIDVSEEQAKQLNVPVGKQKFFIAPDGIIATDSATEDLGTKYFSCRYEHISFEKGKNHMLGAIALKFVRSRHGTSGEGSDFARSRRQELVLKALRDKILSIETLADPGKISNLLTTFGMSIDTDISVKDGIEFYQLMKKMDKTHAIVLNDSAKTGLPGGRQSLLVHPLATDYGGAYVLISQDDDFSIVQDYIRQVLNGEINIDEATASARIGN